MTIKFHSEARKELIKAAEYYEEQVIGLGDAFINEVENVLSVIEQFPSSGTRITPDERRFFVSRYPFGIIYSAEDDLIMIFALNSVLNLFQI